MIICFCSALAEDTLQHLWIMKRFKEEPIFTPDLNQTSKEDHNSNSEDLLCRDKRTDPSPTEELIRTQRKKQPVLDSTFWD